MISDSRLLKGKRAEDSASAHLMDLGYEILGRNVKGKSGEIDIVARVEDYVVVVEVRSRRAGSSLQNSEIVGPGKRRRVVKVAREVINPYLRPGDSIRFDVILVGSDERGRLVDCEHITNAFSSSGEIL